MLAFWFGIVPVLLTLLAVYGASWVTYRASKRLVSPVNWLARRVSRWDPGHPEAADLEPNKLPADMQGETRQLAAALHSLANRVSAHVARERNFTRDASHELRTPLTVIRVASDMALGDESLQPRLRRSLQRIQRAGRDMEAVIDAFLILAREADVEPQIELFDVNDIVRYEVDNANELLGLARCRCTCTAMARCSCMRRRGCCRWWSATWCATHAATPTKGASTCMYTTIGWWCTIPASACPRSAVTGVRTVLSRRTQPSAGHRPGPVDRTQAV